MRCKWLGWVFCNLANFPTPYGIHSWNETLFLSEIPLCCSCNSKTATYAAYDIVIFANFFSTYSQTSIKQPPIKRPPSIKQRLSKVPIHLSVTCYIWYLYSTATSIKWPWPPFCCCKCIIYMVLYLH